MIGDNALNFCVEVIILIALCRPLTYNWFNKGEFLENAFESAKSSTIINIECNLLWLFFFLIFYDFMLSVYDFF